MDRNRSPSGVSDRRTSRRRAPTWVDRGFESPGQGRPVRLRALAVIGP